MQFVMSLPIKRYINVFENIIKKSQDCDVAAIALWIIFFIQFISWHGSSFMHTTCNLFLAIWSMYSNQNISFYAHTSMHFIFCIKLIHSIKWLLLTWCILFLYFSLSTRGILSIICIMHKNIVFTCIVHTMH